jgi:hypothetical protein
VPTAKEKQFNVLISKRGVVYDVQAAIVIAVPGAIHNTLAPIPLPNALVKGISLSVVLQG